MEKLAKKVSGLEGVVKGKGSKSSKQGGAGGWAPADLENRFRRLEQEQRTALREIERRIQAKTEVCHRPCRSRPLTTNYDKRL